VADNAFTNAAARENLADAVAAARILGVAPNPDWQVVHDHIPILKFPDGVTREFATYNGEPIKQADVNLLAYPLHEITDPRAIRRDLDYYISRGDRNGPAMWTSVLAILYERLGMPQKAYDLFKIGYQPNQRPPFGVITESAGSNNPYFATGAGGLLQTMLFGFGGLDITDGGLVQRPTRLPSAWKSLTLTGVGEHRKDYTVK
jgi:trehalose/maltose hydrolase-like predicted phosphorylase